ncbi:lysophospholipase [Saccharomycopsis crataegensis]|uniref:Lysophospholipase NTE1 n=1 Tax=Saccharomycopsis crataegensis TaxID=43959 RepID=A0AAV5QP37_9ASCO|nr:lysophospholipase [Saccharomycopsis crataegensis]
MDVLNISNGIVSAETPATVYKLSMFQLFWSISHWIFAVKLYSVWSFLIQMLTGKIHIAISFSTIFFFIGTIIGGLWLFIRYKYLNLYEKFSNDDPYEPVEPSTTYIDSRDEESKSGFSSYLEEFLSAIKIFGYLDKAVFHELTRSMKTQRLDSGELFALDSSLGFSIVVEGSVNVYSKVSTDSNNVNRTVTHESTDANDTYILNGEKFQLINFVKTGNPLSSLVSILSLFTDNTSNANSPYSEQVVFRVMNRSLSESQAANSLEIFPDYLADDSNEGSPSASNPLVEDDDIYEERLNKLPDLIAQANSNCTIAIIPADSFRRLTRKWPRAASHIVQVVLTRLYRVTFQAAHNYLGMTGEIIDTEIKLNEDCHCQLPKYLTDSVIRKFGDQISENEPKGEKNNLMDDASGEINKDLSMVSSFVSNANTSSCSVLLKRKDSLDDLLTTSSVTSFKRPVAHKNLSRHVLLDSKNIHHPGDLLSNVPISRIGTMELSDDPSLTDLRTKTFSAEEESEDTAIRIAVVENLFKFLGIDEKSINSPMLRNSSSSSLVNLARSPTGSSTQLTKLQSIKTPRTIMKEGSLYRDNFRRNSNDNLMGSSTDSLRRNSLPMLSEEGIPLNYDQAKGEFADGIKFLLFKKDSTIVKQNDPNNGLYYVISGSLEVLYIESTIYNGTIEKHLYTASPGCIAGYLASLVGHKSLVSIRANEDSYVAFLPQETINALCEKYFTIHLSIAKKLVMTMNKELLDMDFAIEWVQAKAGHALYEQDRAATGIYLVLSGRFREIRKISDDQINTLGEFGQGSSLGEVEVLTASKRHSSLVAVRESEAARIPRYLFEFLALKNPSIMIKISRIVAQKVTLQNEPSFDLTISKNSKSFFPNYKTITILPTKYGLPVTEFAEKLISEFKRLDKSVIALDQASVLSHLGKHAFDKLSKLKQSGYFSDLEERYDLIVYVNDTPVNSNWSQTCISQGDCILLLADASSNPAVGEYERLLLKTKTSARTELVLLHPERYVIPGSTNNWLKSRLWVEAHHHIQFRGISINGDIGSSSENIVQGLFLSNLRSKVETFTQDIVERYRNVNGSQNYYTPVAFHKNDFARLARILSGQAIGLVLGGGGARGLSHIGVIETLENEGIPIDIIGGTSIGAFIGGLYAKDYDIVPIYGRAKKFSGRLASIWRTLSDLTYPLVSYTTGHEFNRGIWKAFGDSRIEDFWIRYFCNSTNITNSVMEFHTSGYAWRFIRASMSLCGLVPPIVDHGNMLLDGGYVDNLPCAEMKRQGASLIFAVDVGSVDDRTPMTYGDTLSGFLELLNRYNPFSKAPVVPSMADIQLRLAYVGSVGALERAKATQGVIYLRPPIENFATLAFGKFTEIHDVGKVYATQELKKLRKQGKIPALIGNYEEPTKSDNMLFTRQRRNSI